MSKFRCTIQLNLQRWVCEKNNLPCRAAVPAARNTPLGAPDVLESARTLTVNVHRKGSRRNCRETIASLRNARATRYHVASFLCFLGRQWLRWQRYYILAAITSEC